MKIGILTFHRAHNYGAVLQCYALQRLLQAMGHDVEVIDYRQPYIERLYSIRRVFRRTSFVNRLRILKKGVLGKFIFPKFRYRYLKIGRKCKNNNFPAYDCYIIGSDQVWSSECTLGFDLNYFGEFTRPLSSKLVGYSVSSTVKSLSRMPQDELNRHIAGFNSMSFREKKIAYFVRSVSNKNFPVTLDPVLLPDTDEWEKLYREKEKENVVMYIMYRDSIPDIYQSSRVKCHELAARLNCGVTEIKQSSIGVVDFVRAFASAKAVVTNSFHGVAFSIIFRKPLYAISNGDAIDDRYVGLLNNVDANSHIVDPDFNTSEIKDKLDFNADKLNELRQQSILYIDSAINNEKTR